MNESHQAAAVGESRFLPIISTLARRCRLVETIDQALSCEMEVSPGRVVLAMILDTLAGRSPLYRVQDAFAGRDPGILLGEELAADKLHDDTLGRVLDRLHAHGTNRLLTALSLNMFKLFQIAHNEVHHDTTSISVWGEYAPAKDAPFRITRGFSKNKRFDLKQFVFSLLTTEHGFPLRYSCENGNASDKLINQSVLSQTAAHLQWQPPADDYIFVADSALVTEDNLAILREPETAFVTRLPRNYTECRRAVETAVQIEQWQAIGVLAATPPVGKQQPASYRFYETTVQLYGHTYRAVVIHSDALEQRKRKTLDRHLAASQQQMEEMKKRLERQIYFCLPDAQAAAEAIAPGSYHRCETDVVEQPKYGRGRPAKLRTKPPVAIHYRLRLTVREIPEAITRMRLAAGCFVLLAPLVLEGKTGRTAGELLACYKHQHSIEQDFAFLKDPLIVNALFLKKPERIEAFGLIIVLALMFWRLPEYLLRQSLQDGDAGVEGWNRRRSRRPTSFMMSTKFRNVRVYKQDGQRYFGEPLNEVQVQYLRLLGMEPDIYLTA